MSEDLSNIIIGNGVINPVVFTDKNGKQVLRVEKKRDLLLVTFDGETQLFEHNLGWRNGIVIGK